MDNAIIGYGWPFPVYPLDGGLTLIDGPEKIRQSLWLILKTAPGERLMRPDFGCGIDDLVLRANTATLRGLVRHRVQDAVTRHEPRVDLIDVRVETDPDARNCLLIELSYRIRGDNNLFNLVYPFFLLEGAGTSTPSVI
jgi:phage baseplate assembly protein W